MHGNPLPVVSERFIPDPRTIVQTFPSLTHRQLAGILNGTLTADTEVGPPVTAREDVRNPSPRLRAST